MGPALTLAALGAAHSMTAPASREPRRQRCATSAFDVAISRLVDLWTAAAPADKLHKANSKSKRKRTNDVLPKPDKSECY